MHAVTRAALPSLLFARRPAGHVIDCIGLTGDFRSRPLETAEAHVGLVARCLAELRFQSFLLLSSTRVYSRANTTQEDTALPTLPSDPSDLYNVTKLAGEALCLTNQRPDIRVVRLSNVYGTDMPAGTFLGQVLREGQNSGEVVFRQSATSAKDYVSLSSVVRLLPAIATDGRDRLYNLAAGGNTSHATIADRLTELIGWRTRFGADAPTLWNRPINTARLTAEFGPTSSDLAADLPSMLAIAQEYQCSPSMRHIAA